MKKVLKLISIIAIFSFVISLLVIDASAATTGNCGENLTYSIENGVCTISGTGAMYDYKSSGNLRSPFYSNRNNITKIVIEEGVTSIGNYAFYTCENLTSIEISATVNSIGEYAFFRCYAIESITLPDNVRSLGQRTFSTCTALKNVTFDGFVGFMGANIFDGATAMESVTFTKLSAPMRYWSSSWNTNLKSEASVSWGNETYNNPSYTEGLQFTHSNGSVVVSGYTGNSTVVNIPSEYYAIPIKIIDEYAFYGNKTVEQVVLPETLTSIRQGAFMGCKNLSSINIPDSLNDVAMRAFANCKSLGLTEYNNGYYLSNGTNPYYILCGIKDTDVDSFTVHADTKIIQGELFYTCINLKSINVASGNTNYKSVDGVLFSNNGRTLYAYPKAKEGSAYTVPSGVVTVDKSAFYNNTNLTSVTLSSSVQNVNQYAFANCTQLSDITLSSSLSKIRASAFYNCVSIKTITIPSSVTEIASGAFTGCVNLAEVINKSSLKIAAGDTSNGSVALYAKTVSTSAGNQITTDANGFVFYNDGTKAELIGYTGVGGSITLPASNGGLTYTIASYAFAYNSDITGITINAGVSAIGDYAFAGCENLTNAVVGECVSSIGLGAFEGCDSLSSVTLPFVGKSAAEKTFFGHIFGAKGYYTQNEAVPSSLKSVSLTGSAPVADNAFWGCTGLQSITLSSNASSISIHAFEGCTGLVGNISENGRYIGTASNPYYVLVEIIDKSAVSFKIDSDVVMILPDAFDGADSLQSIALSASSSRYETIDGVLIDTLNSKLIKYPAAKTGTAYTIPNSVISIGAYAFAGNNNLETVNIHSSVKSIGEYAFFDCDGILSFNIPATVTTVEIGILQGCDNISSLTVGKMQGIAENFGHYFGTYSYDNNGEFVPASLKTVVILSGTGIDDHCFFDCRSIEKIVLPEGLLSIGMHAFSQCSSLSDIELPATLESIGYSAFKNCSSIKSIAVPSSVTSVGISAFNGCSALESIELPFVGLKESYSSTSLRNTFGVIFGSSVYEGGYVVRQNFMNSNSDNRSGNWCIPESLKNVTVNGGNINYGTFMNCKSIENISFAKEVNFVDESAISALVFSGCSGLKNINIEDGNHRYSSVGGILLSADKTTLIMCPASKESIDIGLPETITHISASAFANCKNLTVIEIPDSVISIGANAFKGCTSLEVLKVPFIGRAPITENDHDEDFLFGYFFGTGTIEGCTKIYQEISSSKSGTYAIPNSLKTVIVTGNSGGTHINLATFQNCTMLENIVLGSGVTSTANNVFQGCTNATIYVESASGVIGTYSNPNGLDVVYNANIEDFISSNLPKFDVSFAGDGVSLSPIQTTGRVTLPTAADVTAPSGKILSGWSDGVTTYAPGASVYVSGTKTFTAVYIDEEDSYTVTYTGQGVDLSSVSTTGAVTLPTASDITVPADKNFLGWSDGETTYAAGQSITVTKDTTFTAVYEQLYLVSYAGEGVNIASVYAKGSMTLPLAPEREGYDFGGWSNGTTVFTAGANVTIDKNTTFTAVWTKAKQTVNLLPDACEFNTTWANKKAPTASEMGATAYTNEANTNHYRAYSYVYSSSSDFDGDGIVFANRKTGQNPYLGWTYDLNNTSGAITITTRFKTNISAGSMTFTVSDKVAFAINGSDLAVTIDGVTKTSLSKNTIYVATIYIANPNSSNATATVTITDSSNNSIVGTINFGASVDDIDLKYAFVDYENSDERFCIDYIRAIQVSE